MKKQYHPMHKPWSSAQLFSSVTRSDILLSSKDLEKYYPFMLHHLQAESDSTHLHNELKKRLISEDLKNLLEAWHPEELNHAEGYYKMLNILYGTNEATLKTKILNSTPNFIDLKEFLEDEFKFLVLFAFDEFTTTLDYKKNTFYTSFGPKEFPTWINLVIKDEARHFINAIKLIHCKHSHRISETQQVLLKILELERSLEKYNNTFLFDHTESNFLVNFEEMRDICAPQVLKSIIRTM